MSGDREPGAPPARAPRARRGRGARNAPGTSSAPRTQTHAAGTADRALAPARARGRGRRRRACDRAQPGGGQGRRPDLGRLRDRRAGRQAPSSLAAGGGRAAGRLRPNGVWIVRRRRLQAAARRLRRRRLVPQWPLRRRRRRPAARRARPRRRCALDLHGARPGRRPALDRDAVDTRIAYRSGRDLRVIAGDGERRQRSGRRPQRRSDRAGLAADRPTPSSRPGRPSGPTSSSTSTGRGTCAASTPTPANAYHCCDDHRRLDPALGDPHRGLRGPGPGPRRDRDRAAGPHGLARPADRHQARRRRRGPLLRPRPPDRPDLVARRALAARRLARRRSVAVHRRRPPAPSCRRSAASPSSSTPAATARRRSRASRAGSCRSAERGRPG